MNGDFSHWRPFDPTENFSGVLHQQGRVLLDPDWNDQTRIVQHWQGRAGKDIIGDGIAAVPANDPDGFKVTAAQVVTVAGVEHVEFQVHPGHVWANGLLVYLGGDTPDPSAPVTREATYLEPPIQDPAFDPSSIAAGVRDAVILEVSREVVNGFQLPDRLIEPALGGPDTTERIHTRLAFRLFRLEAGEDCHSIRDKLKDDPSKFGKLTVSLQPTVVVPGDCPVVQGGGYTGFEHQLYRIEIAESPASPKFKWSQFNGGLVGRGRFFAAPSRHVEISANLTAIITSGLDTFYLETVELDASGQWQVTCGAVATLNNQQELDLAAPVFGTLPASGNPVFFRLWNGLLDVSAFTNAAAPVELQDGIRLVFDPLAGKTYRPGDFWVFPVRAGEITNPQVLINAQPPQGIRYHRVPLAELDWNAALNLVAPGDIEDCRRRFRPLTQQDTCCTFRVGDRIHSFGDFDQIQAAIDALPPEGGQVCVLPGVFTENIVIADGQNITITGCGKRSVVIGKDPAAGAVAEPVFKVVGGANITIDSLAVQAQETGIGILLEGLNPDFPDDGSRLVNVTLSELFVTASGQSAIRVQYVQQVTIRNCLVQMQDALCLDPAIFAIADDLLIERNVVMALAERDRDLKAVAFIATSHSRGGIQIGGTSDRVRIINNLIEGGAGNGITLGSLIFIDHGDPVPPSEWPRPTPIDPCDPNNPATGQIDDPGIDGGPQIASAGTLTEIIIERNRIYGMGMNGIGVVGFFNLSAIDEFITVENLTIIGNDIRQCLRRTIAPIPDSWTDMIGYGGISLADVERLIIRDNLITDNGPSYVEPVCGIFVLHVEGMEVSRNRILNNGARTSDAETPPKNGRRGGINVVYAVTPTMPFHFGASILPGQNGKPALKVESNIVSTPLGQALSMTALGPLSVVTNEFTSRGVVETGASATLAAATVLIWNLGLSNELYLQFLAFAAISGGSLSMASLAGPVGQPGLDDKQLGAYLANGNVLFANNQCLLDVAETGISLSISSIGILSLDDIGFLGNQCDCNLFDDIVITQLILFGFSVRANNNRFKESLLTAIYSAVTFGLLNNTTHNQATHCMLIRAFLPAYLVDAPNTVLIAPTGRCELYAETAATFGQNIKG